MVIVPVCCIIHRASQFSPKPMPRCLQTLSSACHHRFRNVEGSKFFHCLTHSHSRHASSSPMSNPGLFLHLPLRSVKALFRALLSPRHSRPAAVTRRLIGMVPGAWAWQPTASLTSATPLQDISRVVTEVSPKAWCRCAPCKHNSFSSSTTSDGPQG
jgi:hypothetical protein